MSLPNMIKKYIFSKKACFFSMILLSFAAPVWAAIDFNGEWSGAVGNENSFDYSTLNIKLRQVDGKVVGRYCYITNSGNRIDCPDGDENNLHGVVKNNKANVKFDSVFGGENGEAELTLNNNAMLWHLIVLPSHGEFYAPKDFFLKKIEPNRNVMLKSRFFSTSGFTVTLVNNCGNFYTSCKKVKYYGMRNSDGSQISLTGHTIDSPDAAKAVGMIFNNGNIEYGINFEPLTLTVSRDKKVLLSQDGKWE
ncbi:hypothetical protein QM327_00020 [Pantoea dispersa]|uniref:hypothetical protein n=1 Tax=Pantoea dispersa TaxID=59814 RepID=UPI0024B82997|nr:hypothetical protein [Pantoea dispersa]MDI9764945.1 hypothetical protein [Pantoea dispersa]